VMRVLNILGIIDMSSAQISRYPAALADGE
jgi:hypothetical protein